MRVRLLRVNPNGFSLLELVAGVTVFAVVMTIVTGVVAPQAQKTIEPMQQVRATELAQSLLNEILGKYYDENSDRAGGRIRCNEDLDSSGTIIDTAGSTDDDGERICTLYPGPEDGGTSTDCNGFSATRANDSETDRADFDDIDDYHGMVYTSSDILENSLGENLVVNIDSEDIELYNNFQLSVSVIYDENMDGVADQSGGSCISSNSKLITLLVTTPSGAELNFATYKHNY